MAGSISAATGLAIAGLTAGAVGTGYSIYNGQKQAGVQKKALASQNTAQQQAQAGALSTDRQSAVAQKAANMQTPNVSAIMARAAMMGNQGLSSTMLTGPTGVNAGNMTLGKNSLLGS